MILACTVQVDPGRGVAMRGMNYLDASVGARGVHRWASVVSVARIKPRRYAMVIRLMSMPPCGPVRDASLRACQRASLGSDL